MSNPDKERKRTIEDYDFVVPMFFLSIFYILGSCMPSLCYEALKLILYADSFRRMFLLATYCGLMLSFVIGGALMNYFELGTLNQLWIAQLVNDMFLAICYSPWMFLLNNGSVLELFSRAFFHGIFVAAEALDSNLGFIEQCLITWYLMMADQYANSINTGSINLPRMYVICLVFIIGISLLIADAVLQRVGRQRPHWSFMQGRKRLPYLQPLGLICLNAGWMMFTLKALNTLSGRRQAS